MSVVFVAFALRGSRDLMRSQYLYVPNVRGRLSVSFTPFPLFLRGAAFILPITVKVAILSLRKVRRSPARGNKKGKKLHNEGVAIASHWRLGQCGW